MAERYAHIVGWGMYVPTQVWTNDDLARRMDTSDDWIASRTGIRQRHIASSKDTTLSLAVRAAEEALYVAGMHGEEIDLIIVATSTPEYIFPSTASLVQDAIGAARAAAYDISAACTGFVYALSIATHTIRAGGAQTALVIGAETMSRILNWEDRNTCVLFGDGAGAVVLKVNTEPGGVLDTYLRSDGSGAEMLKVPGGGSRHPASPESLAAALHAIHMDGREVFRFATRAMANAVKHSLQAGNLTIEQIALIIPHQANIRITESGARTMGIPLEKFFMNIDRYGNTSAASIPIALCEAVEQHRLKPNDYTIFVAFGGGLTWGSTLIKWDVTPTPPGRWRRLENRGRFWAAHFRSLWTRILRRLESIVRGPAAGEETQRQAKDKDDRDKRDRSGGPPPATPLTSEAPAPSIASPAAARPAVSGVSGTPSESAPSIASPAVSGTPAKDKAAADKEASAAARAARRAARAARANIASPAASGTPASAPVSAPASPSAPSNPPEPPQEKQK